MRRFSKSMMAAAVALAGALAVIAPAQAGGDGNDYVCWMQPSGVTACAGLPEPYDVRDIPGKPHRHNGTQPCKHCQVDFQLTHPNIRDFGKYVDNSTMRRFHDATLYGSKNRRVRHN